MNPLAKLASVAVSLGTVGGLSAASIDLGAADPFLWSMLSLEDKTKIKDDSLIQDFDPGGIPLDIGRMVGVYVDGKFEAKDATNIAGTVVVSDGGKLKVGDDVTVSGGIFGSNLEGDPGNVTVFDISQDALLDNAAADAFSFSNLYAGLSATNPLSGKIEDTMTITGMAGLNVLNVEEIYLKDGEVLTLDGGGADASFIINIEKNLKLDEAQVLLTGGLTFDEVLFNIIDGDAKLQGEDLQPNPLLQGIVLAPDGKVEVKEGVVEGTVIGKKIYLKYDGGIITTIPEPGTVSLIALALLGLGVRRRK